MDRNELIATRHVLASIPFAWLTILLIYLFSTSLAAKEGMGAFVTDPKELPFHWVGSVLLLLMPVAILSMVANTYLQIACFEKNELHKTRFWLFVASALGFFLLAFFNGFGTLFDWLMD